MVNVSTYLLIYFFQSRAVLVMLSLGQFVKVIEMLYSMRHFDQAALFVEACQEFKLLPTNDETSILLSYFHCTEQWKISPKGLILNLDH